MCSFHEFVELTLLLCIDLEWKVTYLSTPDDDNLDQELESVLVGPISPGVYKFVLEVSVDPPDGDKIPVDDLIGNSAVVVSCLFNDHEFIRVGFYVNVEYKDEELREHPPEHPVFDKLIRNVANDNPRITTKPLEMQIKNQSQEQEEEEEQEDSEREVEPQLQETSDEKETKSNTQTSDFVLILYRRYSIKLAESIGRPRRGSRSFRGSWDFAGSDSASDTSSWNKRASFASSENLQSAARSLQLALKGKTTVSRTLASSYFVEYGFSGKVNLLASDSPEDTANTLNCIHQLLQRLQHEQLLRNDAQAEYRRIKGDLQSMEATLQKLRREIEIRERDIGTLKIRDRQMQASHQEELILLIRDRDNLQKECNNLSQRQIQFQHEIRRKEVNYEWLQEKLRKYLADRKKESEASMEIVGRLRKQRPQTDKGKIASKLDELIPGRSNSANKMTRMPKLDESMVKMIVSAYEEKRQELLAENQDLQNALNNVRKEYAQIMNSSRQSLASPTRLPSDGNAVTIFVTNHDKVSKTEDTELPTPVEDKTMVTDDQHLQDVQLDRDQYLQDAQMESQPIEETQNCANSTAESDPVNTSPDEVNQGDELEVQPRQSELVPWPMPTTSKVPSTGPVNPAIQQVIESSSQTPSVDSTDNMEAPEVEENLNARLPDKAYGLTTVTEEAEESLRTEKSENYVLNDDQELSIKSIQQPTVSLEEIKDSEISLTEKLDPQSENLETKEDHSSLVYDSTQPTQVTEKDNEISNRISTDVKLEVSVSQESRPSLKASPFESMNSPNSDVSVSIAASPGKDSKFPWPPPSATSTPSARDNPSPPRRRKTFKLPESSSKPVPNVAHLSEEQLRKELRTRAVDVEESVRALKSACSSMRPQDMKTVMERRLHMEFQMAANLAEQQEAVVNLAVAGLEKAKRLGPISDTEWGVAAQSVSNSVDKSEELVTQMGTVLTTDGTPDKELVSSLLQQFQTHLDGIRTELQGAKNRILEKTSSFADQPSSAEALEKNILSLRERADGLTKQKDLLNQAKGEIEGTVQSVAPRQTWAGRSQADKGKTRGDQDGLSSDEEETEDRKLGDILSLGTTSMML
eukprot:g1164.t1